MQPVLAKDLVKGRQYRVEHPSLLPHLGTFMENYNTSLGIQSQFNNLICSDKRKEDPLTCSTYMESEWQFYESSSSLIAEQAARGLCDRIPEDTAGLIERFLMPKSRSKPDRYPQRSITIGLSNA